MFRTRVLKITRVRLEPSRLRCGVLADRGALCTMQEVPAAPCTRPLNLGRKGRKIRERKVTSHKRGFVNEKVKTRDIAPTKWKIGVMGGDRSDRLTWNWRTQKPRHHTQIQKQKTDSVVFSVYKSSHYESIYRVVAGAIPCTCDLCVHLARLRPAPEKHHGWMH